MFKFPVGIFDIWLHSEDIGIQRNSQWQQIFTNLTRTYVEKTALSMK